MIYRYYIQRNIFVYDNLWWTYKISINFSTPLDRFVWINMAMEHWIWSCIDGQWPFCILRINPPEGPGVDSNIICNTEILKKVPKFVARVHEASAMIFMVQWHLLGNRCKQLTVTTTASSIVNYLIIFFDQGIQQPGMYKKEDKENDASQLQGFDSLK